MLTTSALIEFAPAIVGPLEDKMSAMGDPLQRVMTELQKFCETRGPDAARHALERIETGHVYGFAFYTNRYDCGCLIGNEVARLGGKDEYSCHVDDGVIEDIREAISGDITMLSFEHFIYSVIPPQNQFTCPELAFVHLVIHGWLNNHSVIQD